MSVTRTAQKPRPAAALVAGTGIFLLLTVAGLAYVKWIPYWGKAHVAASTHAIGTSIVSGTSVVPPAVSLAAAWGYALAYFGAVWEAVILALLLGAAVQALVPRKWLLRLIGGANARSATTAAALALGGMMCTCCTAPIIVGIRKQHVSAGSSLAFFLGNPVLNPAVLIFIGLVLGWQFTLARVLAGVVLIAIVAALGNRMAPEHVPASAQAMQLAPIEEPGANASTVTLAFLRELWHECVTILPGYIVIVLLLGAVRAWFFHPGITLHASGIGATALLALTGTAFVIPTAGEVPIVQTLMQHGLGAGPAIALLVTLPAISLPSIYIVRRVFPARVLAMTFGVVFAIGLLAGFIATVS